MTTSKKPRQSSAPKIGRPAAVPQPAFEMTADEMALAVRFFSACRRMDDGHRKQAMTLVSAVEDLAQKFPLRAVPALRLVGGGAK